LIFWVAAIFLLPVSYGRPPLALAGFLVQILPEERLNTINNVRFKDIPTYTSKHLMNLCTEKYASCMHASTWPDAWHIWKFASKSHHKWQTLKTFQTLKTQSSA